MLVSGVQQSDSVIHVHIFILFKILFLYRLSQNIELSSLCYTVGPCWLSILYIVCVYVLHIYIYIYILFHILFHYGLSQDIEYSSLCYTVGPCLFSILYIVCVYVLHVYIYIYIFFFIFYSIMVYHRILNIVPCAIQ